MPVSTKRIKKPHRISTKAKLRLHYYRILLETSNFVDKFRKDKLPSEKDEDDDNGLYRDLGTKEDQRTSRPSKKRTQKSSPERTRKENPTPVKSSLFSSSPTSSVDQIVRKGRLKLRPSPSAGQFYQFQYERVNKSYADLYLGPSHGQILKNKLVSFEEEQEQEIVKTLRGHRVRAVSSDESIFRRKDVRQRRRRSSRTRRRSGETNSYKDVGGDRPNNNDESPRGRGKKGGHDEIMYPPQSGDIREEEIIQADSDHGKLRISRRRTHLENNGDDEIICLPQSGDIREEEIIRADSDHGKICISRHRIHPRAEINNNLEDDDDADRGWTVETKTMEIVHVTSEESPREEENALVQLQRDEKVDQVKGHADAKKLAKQVRLQGLKRRKQLVQKSMTDSLSAIKSTIHALTHRRRDPSAYNIKSYPLRFGLSVVDPRRKAAPPTPSSSLFDPISGRRLKPKKDNDDDNGSILTKIFDAMSSKKGGKEISTPKNNYNQPTKSHSNNNKNNTPEPNLIRKTLSEIYQQSGSKTRSSYYHDSPSDDEQIREYYYKPQSPMTEKYAELLRK